VVIHQLYTIPKYCIAEMTNYTIFVCSAMHGLMSAGCLLGSLSVPGGLLSCVFMLFFGICRALI